jgi:replication initiation and membrane attachment protein DnaB
MTNNRKGQKKRRQTMQRVKRKEDKHPKWSKEKTTSNGKGQNKRGQTIEMIKRREDKQPKGSKE